MALTQVKSDGIADGAVTTNNLSDSGVTAGTYGSSSAIPAITVDAKGRVTSATTSAIDSTAITNGTSNVSVAASGDITVTRAGSTAMTFTGSGPLIPDGQEMRFGTSADFRIYHDGSHTYLDDVGTGDIILRNDATLWIRNQAGNENKAQFDSNGGCYLYYDNSQKFATTSSGIDVTGTVTCDGLVCEGEATIVSGTGVFFLKDSNSTGIGTQCYISGRDSANSEVWYVGQTSGGSAAVDIVNTQNAGIFFGTNNLYRSYISSSGHYVPYSNNTYDLGSSSQRWRNIYTNDLNLSNEGGANDVDGTWGSWTIQEGEDDLFLLNRRNGKKYKFNLSEVN